MSTTNGSQPTIAASKHAAQPKTPHSAPTMQPADRMTIQEAQAMAELLTRARLTQAEALWANALLGRLVQHDNG